MRRGCPAKGNILGLKNQTVSPVPSQDSSYQSTSLTASGFDQQDIIVDERQHPILPDSTRTNWEEEDVVPLDSDLDDQMELDIWDDARGHQEFRCDPGSIFTNKDSILTPPPSAKTYLNR